MRREAITPAAKHLTDSRPGFDVDFLGIRVPLPSSTAPIATLPRVVKGKSTELKYFNYSVI